MSIRLAEYKDLEQMVKIYNQAIETHRCTADMDTFSVEERISWFQEHQCLEYPLYVYEIDNKVVGYLHFTGYRKGRRAMRYTAEISYYIHNDYQRQGIGTKMMEFALEKSKELNLKNLIAILLEWNIPSIRLLEKFGFKEWGYLPKVADFDGEVCSHLYYGLKV
ncbi:GNAT family N-acetyltransferase [Clostridium kluyveri]|uniref:N-acetyltransferase n=1 Tax=Clostridium kluyveri TaxID=1534 RepID=A0A1L5F4E5_CLOKL|nr:GNAT family N-acetyltransferase [Clostridium kluyveri]APM37888.1 N-acetyltransferase [Clostridium kluyveri]UZQ52109.1 GNAT family N-acetyltransferase [Clostridium kluyveri]